MKSFIRGTNNSNRILRPKFDEPCVLTLRGVQYTDETFSKKNGGKKRAKMGKTHWSCELQGDDATKAGHSFVKVKGLSDKFFAKHDVQSGLTTLSVEGAVINGTEMIIPPDVAPTLGVNRRRLSENLAEVTGERNVLVVRVIANDKTTSGSEEWLSQKVFTDGTTMKSQYAACSHGKLNFVPANGTGVTPNLGTTTVTIKAKVTNADVDAIEELIEAAVQEKVGVSDLSTKFHHVMFCVPEGTLSEGKSW